MSVNEQSRELHKPVIKNVRKRTVNASCKDSIWAADLAEMGLSSFNHGFKNLLCVTYFQKIRLG